MGSFKNWLTTLFWISSANYIPSTNPVVILDTPHREVGSGLFQGPMDGWLQPFKSQTVTSAVLNLMGRKNKKTKVDYVTQREMNSRKSKQLWFFGVWFVGSSFIFLQYGKPILCLCPAKKLKQNHNFSFGGRKPALQGEACLGLSTETSVANYEPQSERGTQITLEMVCLLPSDSATMP